MLSGLIFGLASLFTSQAALPTATAVKQELPAYAQHFVLNKDNVYVRPMSMDNPSPFLTSGGTASCVVYINDNSNAKRVWSYMLDGADKPLARAFTIFSVGHEFTHCLLGEPGQRLAKRTALEHFLNYRFSSNTQFEETYADLVGLSFLQDQDPAYFEPVLQRLKKVRDEFSGNDPEHDSAQFLTLSNISFASDLAKQRPSLKVASNP